MRRADTVWDRYIALALVLALPYSLLPWAQPYLRTPRRRALLMTALLLSGVLAIDRRWPNLPITRSFPSAMMRVADWMHGRDDRACAILLTRMNWESTHLALFAPQLADRITVVSDFIPDAQIDAALRSRSCVLFITRSDDRIHRERVERLRGKAVGAAERIATIDQLEIYEWAPGRRDGRS